MDEVFSNPVVKLDDSMAPGEAFVGSTQLAPDERDQKEHEYIGEEQEHDRHDDNSDDGSYQGDEYCWKCGHYDCPQLNDYRNLCLAHGRNCFQCGKLNHFESQCYN